MKKSTLTALGLAAALFAGQAIAETPVATDGKGPHGGHHRGKMFEKTDTNKDGVVTRDEFHAQGDKMFSKLDSNGDGKIDQSEREAKRKEWEAKKAEWKAKKDAAAKAE